MRESSLNPRLKIRDDAIFIADSHTQKNRDGLIFWLENLREIPSQIFLLGDIANMLVGGVKSSLAENERLLLCLKNLAQKTQIFYFEGNHDFNVSAAFEAGFALDWEARFTANLGAGANLKTDANLIVVKRASQPLLADFAGKAVLLAHGDLFLDLRYEIYIKILTSRFALKCLAWLDCATFGALYRALQKRIAAKEIRTPRDPKSLIESRIQAYRGYLDSPQNSPRRDSQDSPTDSRRQDSPRDSPDSRPKPSPKTPRIDYVIEGHFHIGEVAAGGGFTYIGLPSFYCDGRVFCLKNLANIAPTHGESATD